MSGDDPDATVGKAGGAGAAGTTTGGGGAGTTTGGGAGTTTAGGGAGTTTGGGGSESSMTKDEVNGDAHLKAIRHRSRTACTFHGLS